jgi:hypothetical protein
VTIKTKEQKNKAMSTIWPVLFPPSSISSWSSIFTRPNIMGRATSDAQLSPVDTCERQTPFRERERERESERERERERYGESGRREFGREFLGAGFSKFK